MTVYEISFAASAKREFRDLSPDVIERIRPKYGILPTIHGLRAAKSCVAIGTVGESVLAITASCMPSTIRLKPWM